MEEPARVRGFRRCTDKQQRTRDGQIRDSERDDETDGRTDGLTDGLTNKPKLRLGHPKKPPFVVSTELIK